MSMHTTPTRPRSSHTAWRFFVLLGAAFALLGPGCECEEQVAPINDPPGLPTCDLDTECGEREAYRYGQCTVAGCEADTDCCPGSRCRLEFNSCWPRQLDSEFSCDTDADCPDPAQRCVETSIGGRDPIPVCVYERCEGDTDCGLGRACFHSVCVAKAPCGGGCPVGEVCDVLTSTCMATEGVGCTRDCGTSAMLVASDPDSMSGEQCCSTICQCKALPPLVPYRYGKYARTAVSSSEILVSAYDHEYGDLVVVHHKSDGSFHSVEYVDGVPAGAVAVADALGPRSGIVEAGPNVGTHTSIAVDGAGQPRVAYHDVDNGTLKVAVKTATGWVTMTVDDGGDGKVGQFTDIAVDPVSGNIVVTYTALDVAGAPGISGPASGVKMARSTVPEPTTSADWELLFVDAVASFDACANNCGATEECVLEDGAGACRATTTGCNPGCNAVSHCVTVDGAATCMPNVLPEAPEGMPRARGLHTRVLPAADGSLYAANYDSVLGQVRLSKLNSAGTGFDTVVIDGDGQDGRSGQDVGRFPAIAALSTGDVVVVYEDAATHKVLLWQGPFGEAGTREVLDDGREGADIGSHFVGAGAALRLANDLPVVVYQDASSLDLKLAQKSGTGTWTRTVLLDDGAHGFYADLVLQDGAAIISSVKAELDARSTEASRVLLITQSLTP